MSQILVAETLAPSTTEQYLDRPEQPLVEQGLDNGPLNDQPELIRPNIDHIITEDDTPVDNMPSEKQQRLLTEALYSSREQAPLNWPFLVLANVGLFYGINQPAIVPDVLLSLDVQVADDWWERRNRSYFVWEFGKVPEIVIEIVSNKVGEEDGQKMGRYAGISIPYYAIFDPQTLLSEEVLRVYRLDLQQHSYQQMHHAWFPMINLGLKLWAGEYEGKQAVWLRWCDNLGEIIPTGRERAEQEQQRAEQERQRAEQEQQWAVQESQRAKQEQQKRELVQLQAAEERQERILAQQQAAQERQRSERLLAQLKALGIEPDA